jgi:two-component system alkaline phosphatase synthesis response regulator PhoP
MTKVLIIEDDLLVAKMYQKVLASDKIDSEIAIGGEKGLEKVDKYKPDLILLDIMMPQPDGIQVLAQLKKNPETKDIPVVIQTNLSGKFDADLARSKGAIDFWIKNETDLKDVGKKIKEILKN